MSDSCNPWTVAHQAPLSMRLSRQGYWNGLPFPSPVVDMHRLNCSMACAGSGIKPMSPGLAGRLVTTGPPGRPRTVDFGVLSAFILKGDHVILELCR